MKRLSLILLVLLAPLFQACLRDRITLAPAELEFYIECPGVPEDTKGSEGEVSSKSRSEYTVHSLRVWVFNHDTQVRLESGYLDLSAGQLPSAGRVRRYVIQVPPEFAADKPAVDVFAIANAASVGCGLGEDATWDQLNEAVFGKTATADKFGVSDPVRGVDPELGLPMTAVGLGLPIQGDEPVLKIETVKLVRAVSKVRYVFCRMEDEDALNPDVISVDKVTLLGNLIPNTEYLFTSSAISIVPDFYDPHSLETSKALTLAKNDTPERLVFAPGQNAESYEALLDAAVANGTLTDYGTIYLRESDQMLSGSISYTINGESLSKNFNMASPGDFARNHTWTLYGYFLSGRNLQLSVLVLPWDYSEYSIDFSDETVQSSQLSIDGSTVSIKASSHPDFDTDVRLLAGVTAKAHFYIYTPKGGTVSIQPHGDVGAFIVTPDKATINPDVNSGRIDIEIRRNPDFQDETTGKYIWLTFHLELGEREADLESEILNGTKYRFIL